MKRHLRFSEWCVMSEGVDLQELNIKGVSAISAAAVIVMQASKIKMLLNRVPSERYTEEKLNQLAAALDALNTKTTALAALIYGLSGKR